MECEDREGELENSRGIHNKNIEGILRRLEQ